MHLRRLFPLILTLVLTATCVHAATFTVDRTDDEVTADDCDSQIDNDCSLRGAILAANALAEASTINVPAGTYVLSQESPCTFSVQPDPTTFFTLSHIPLCLSKQVTIQGAGAATTIIDGDRRVRVLFVSASAVAELRGVTIANGLGDRSFGNPALIALPHGGGIMNEGTLTLTESVVRNNSVPAGAVNGGGIYNTGVLTLQRSAVSDNVSPGGQLGGGIFNHAQAVLLLSDSTISNNVTSTSGGGIGNHGGVVTITNSTVSGNTTDGLGGGIASFDALPFTATLTVVNSTISGNTSGSAGGGISTSSGLADLNNVTITNNTGATGAGSGGGVWNYTGVLTLRNTVIAGNRDLLIGASPDCAGTLISRGYNLVQDTTGCIITGDLTGNITGQDAQLGLLANNGGPTNTHALLAGSPAIDAGTPTAPGSGGLACVALDQRGIPRPQGIACDIGAYESFQGESLRILPNTGGNTGSVLAIVYGFDVATGATVKLRRAGQPDILGDPVASGGTSILSTKILSTNFNLAGKPTGAWDVVVANPDGTSATLSGGFMIEEPRTPQLWADVIGFGRVRVGLPARFTVLFGNRGNVDTVAVPLVLTVPADIGLNLRFQVMPPLPQTGQVSTDWSQVPINPVIGGLTYVPLLVPVVPAGFTGTLEFTVTAPSTRLGIPFEIRAEIGSPSLDSLITLSIDGARSYAQNTLGVDLPPSLNPQLEQYITTQLQNAVEHGRNTAVMRFNTTTEVYSLPQLVVDLAQFGVAQTLASTDSVPGNLRGAANVPDWSGLALQRQHPRLGQTQTLATEWVGSIARWVSWLFQPREAQAQSSSSCAERGMAYDTRRGKCIPDGCGRALAGGGQGEGILGGQCGGGTSPIPSISRDPNDKVGSLGVGTAHYLAGSEPLRYAIFFENMETADLPAQEVVITDQLDGAKVDFDTFSLGPIGFGNTTVTPPPGLSQYSTSVDLRPANDLIVGIDARLDKSTGLITWRFTSIDPLTGQFTEDPEAGFLPPTSTRRKVTAVSCLPSSPKSPARRSATRQASSLIRMLPSRRRSGVTRLMIRSRPVRSWL